MTAVLVVNSGSSSLKLSVVAADGALRGANALDWHADDRAAGLDGALGAAIRQLEAAGALQGVVGVGHRFVHGGARFSAPVAVDEEVVAALAELTALAPLHTSAAIEALESQRRVLPHLPAVVAFDTHFHANLPEEAFVYALPWEWYADWGIRRYGFHGLSVDWSVRRSAEMLGRPAETLGLVVAHLGSGCSVTAVRGGRSVATSMGLTPLDGVVMGTRAGAVDPGVLLKVLRDGRVDLETLSQVLERQSGLMGISGVSGDLREVEEAARAGSARAALALRVFVHRAAEGIAAAAASLERVDAIVFTGGIGENADSVVRGITTRLLILGVDDALATAPPDATLSRPGARIAVLRVHAREDIVIAEAVRRALGPASR